MSSTSTPATLSLDSWTPSSTGFFPILPTHFCSSGPYICYTLCWKPCSLDPWMGGSILAPRLPSQGSFPWPFQWTQSLSYPYIFSLLFFSLPHHSLKLLLLPYWFFAWSLPSSKPAFFCSWLGLQQDVRHTIYIQRMFEGMNVCLHRHISFTHSRWST